MPFRVRRDGDDLVKQPDETLLIMRTLITALGGTAFRGRVPIADGIEAFLFDRDGQGILVLWATDNRSGVKELAINLTDSPTRIDLWGNASPLLQIGGRARNTVAVDIGDISRAHHRG